MITPSKLTVVLIEDDVDESELFSNAIQLLKLPHDVLHLNSCEELPDRFAGTSQIDLIILDLSLPGISGMECLKQLKAHPIYSSIPVLIMTVSKEIQTINAAYESGAHFYVVKPYSHGNYVETIRLLFLTDWKSRPEVPPRDKFVVNLAFA
jgi:CheY-like chemotaxis protein